MLTTLNNVRLLILLLVIGLFPLNAGAEKYDYPFDDPFVATVVGTPLKFRADLPKKIPLKTDSIKIFEDRVTPDFLWFDDELKYSYALQSESAPLVFMVAGTGQPHDSATNQDMAKAFYQAGFHVVALSSPTHMNHIVAGSKTKVPGHAVHDAEDLYRIMERIWAILQDDDVEVNDFYVTGYSLGAFNAAFVTQLDEERQVFNFKKALLINPPVNLYNSISLLDRMLESIPGGVDNFSTFFNKLVAAVSMIYKHSTTVKISEDFLYQAYEALNIKDGELAALIGTVFRISAGNMAFTSDMMNNYGYIVPKNVTFTEGSSPGDYQFVAYRLGFTDYFHTYFLPYYQVEDPTLTRDRVIEQMSLTHIQGYLKTADKIHVMHNENDLILKTGEIDFFRKTFGDRAKIYPKGGHLGNINYRDNVAHMIKVFTK
jgi:hypothetical protein